MFSLRLSLASRSGGNRNTPSHFMLQKPDEPLDSYADFNKLRTEKLSNIFHKVMAFVNALENPYKEDLISTFETTMM